MMDLQDLKEFTDVLHSSPEILSSPMSLGEPDCFVEPETLKKCDNTAMTRWKNSNVRSTHEIVPKYREIFSHQFFNSVQSQVIDDALYSDKSLVISAPTGSGKTVIFEMAMAQLLMDLEQRNYKGDFKIIYIAPIKALCTEKMTEWYPKFTPLGCNCREVTGDTDTDIVDLKTYKIILTTPEKWDSLTRKWTKQKELVQTIRLFMIDEVHLLNDPSRGPVLEAIVSRMKIIEQSMKSEYRLNKLQNLSGDLNGVLEPKIRYVAVSATISNPEDVAAWLSSPDKPAVFYSMGEECRPVKVRKIVEGYPCPEGTGTFKFDIFLNYKITPIIKRYCEGKPTLVFCSTRKSVMMTAEVIAKEISIQFSEAQKYKLSQLAATIKDKKVQALILKGVGCHHAGFIYNERYNIENIFRNRELPILVTTTTLAMGVNLPARLVIVKNTQQYIDGGYKEYSMSTLLQMIGRAGRPQFDTEGTAVIMTRNQDKHRYSQLVLGCGPLESSLHKRLAEHLNSEVALGSVTEMAHTVQWARSTFLYVRAAKEPYKYLSLPAGKTTREQLENKIEDLCVKAMNSLVREGMISMDQSTGVTSTPAGLLMSHFCLDFHTMKQIMKIQGTEMIPDLLNLVCESHELIDSRLRVEERKNLNSLNKNKGAPTIRYPVKGKINSKAAKITCLIQATLGCIQIPDPSLAQETTKIMRIAEKVAKCMVSYLTRPEFVKTKPPYFRAVLSAVSLYQCLVAKLWEDSKYVCRQLRGIGAVLSSHLVSAGKTTFDEISRSNPRDLERILSKHPPVGNAIIKQVSLLPKYTIEMFQLENGAFSVEIGLKNLDEMLKDSAELTAGDHHRFFIIVGDSNNNLLFAESYSDRYLLNGTENIVSITFGLKERDIISVHVHCVSTSIVGIDVTAAVNLKRENDFNFSTQTVSSPQPSQRPQKQLKITEVFKEKKKRNFDGPKKCFNTIKSFIDGCTKTDIGHSKPIQRVHHNPQNSTSNIVNCSAETVIIEEEPLEDIADWNDDFNSQKSNSGDFNNFDDLLRDVEHQMNKTPTKTPANRKSLPQSDEIPYKRRKTEKEWYGDPYSKVKTYDFYDCDEELSSASNDKNSASILSKKVQCGLNSYMSRITNKKGNISDEIKSIINYSDKDTNGDLPKIAPTATFDENITIEGLFVDENDEELTNQVVELYNSQYNDTDGRAYTDNTEGNVLEIEEDVNKIDEVFPVIDLTNKNANSSNISVSQCSSSVQILGLGENYTIEELLENDKEEEFTEQISETKISEESTYPIKNGFEMGEFRNYQEPCSNVIDTIGVAPSKKGLVTYIDSYENVTNSGKVEQAKCMGDLDISRYQTTPYNATFSKPKMPRLTPIQLHEKNNTLALQPVQSKSPAMTKSIRVLHDKMSKFGLVKVPSQVNKFILNETIKPPHSYLSRVLPLANKASHSVLVDNKGQVSLSSNNLNEVVHKSLILNSSLQNTTTTFKEALPKKTVKKTLRFQLDLETIVEEYDNFDHDKIQLNASFDGLERKDDDFFQSGFIESNECFSNKNDEQAKVNIENYKASILTQNHIFKDGVNVPCTENIMQGPEKSNDIPYTKITMRSFQPPLLRTATTVENVLHKSIPMAESQTKTTCAGTNYGIQCYLKPVESYSKLMKLVENKIVESTLTGFSSHPVKTNNVNVFTSQSLNEPNQADINESSSTVLAHDHTPQRDINSILKRHSETIRQQSSTKQERQIPKFTATCSNVTPKLLQKCNYNKTEKNVLDYVIYGNEPENDNTKQSDTIISNIDRLILSKYENNAMNKLPEVTPIHLDHNEHEYSNMLFEGDQGNFSPKVTPPKSIPSFDESFMTPLQMITEMNKVQATHVPPPNVGDYLQASYSDDNDSPNGETWILSEKDEDYSQNRFAYNASFASQSRSRTSSAINSFKFKKEKMRTRRPFDAYPIVNQVTRYRNAFIER